MPPLHRPLGRGRGRRGGRGDFPSLLPHAPLVAALVVDSGSGLLAMLVFLVTFLFALSSLCWCCSSRCVPSCGRQAPDAWHHGRYAPEGLFRALIPAVICARLVLLVFRLALCSLWLSAGPRAGRYGPEAQLCSWLVLTGDDALRAVLPFIVVRPKMLGIMACMTRGDDVICSRIQLFGSTVDTYLRQSTEAWYVIQTVENCGNSAVAVHRWSSNFLSWCRGGVPWSCCSADHGDSTVAVLVRGDRRPCCAGRASFHPGRGVEVFSHGPDCCRTIEFPSSWIRWMMSLLCSRTGSHVQVWRRHSCSHSCSSLRTSMVINIPVLAQRLIHRVFTF